MKPTFGECRSGAGRPYLEGSSIYDLSNMGNGGKYSMPGITDDPQQRYVMTMSAAPAGTPPECATSLGYEGSNLQAIAYATSDTVDGSAGPDGITGYTYRGILFCGGSAEWTNHGSLAVLNTWNTPSAKRLVYLYHDGPSYPHNRKPRIDCVIDSYGKLLTQHRTNEGLSWCMTAWSVVAFSTNGKWVTAEDATNGGPPAGTIQTRADRIGWWEEFQLFNTGTTMRIQAGPTRSGSNQLLERAVRGSSHRQHGRGLRSRAAPGVGRRVVHQDTRQQPVPVRESRSQQQAPETRGHGAGLLVPIPHQHDVLTRANHRPAHDPVGGSVDCHT